MDDKSKRRGEPVAYQVRFMVGMPWMGCDEAAFDIVNRTRPGDARALYLGPHPAEPVKVPSDEELIAWASEEQFFLFCDEDEFLDIARALLARYGQPVEPEGWQLVPKVPTYEMIKALWGTIIDNHNTTDGGYKAMLEAAPKFGEEE